MRSQAGAPGSASSPPSPSAAATKGPASVNRRPMYRRRKEELVDEETGRSQRREERRTMGKVKNEMRRRQTHVTLGFLVQLNEKVADAEILNKTTACGCQDEDN